MPNSLVIVESPAKARTIEKYLGPDYHVLASYGHLQDLKSKDGAINVEQDYAPDYELNKGSEKHLREIVSALGSCDHLYLASDPDREGEAISWSVVRLLEARKKLGDMKVHRIVFHEITREAVTQALEQPRELSMDLVDAYQARRAIDHLVGFSLSPLLWRKIGPNLSAGRVQSPALRMVVEREAEIQKFEAQEYWSVVANLGHDGHEFEAKLRALRGKKLKKYDLKTQEQAFGARDLVRAHADNLVVASVTHKQRKRRPTPPFTTSTLQQEAARKLGFSARKTMNMAQRLYEGGAESGGLITYMRTDSVTLSESALKNLRGVISSRYGANQMPEKPVRYKTRTKNAQEAHEAIRPTDAKRTPEKIAGSLDSDQQKLYELIWKRAVASQMIPAILDTVTVDLDGGGEVLMRASGSHVRVQGFMQVYLEGRDDKVRVGDKDERILPAMEEGQKLALRDVQASQHFTEPPPRYSEASLVKALEENGIGRPSTYASILSTLTQREYATLENRAFHPTTMGKAVCQFLTEHFSHYVDYQFTAEMEDSLDEVARGETNWVPLVDSFWKPFAQQLQVKSETVSREEAQQLRELGTDPKSGKPVRVRIGRYGPYVQVGDREDEEKPRFASLREGQELETLTLEEALELLELPRNLGEGDDGEVIEANYGRYGPYIKYGPKKFVSLPEGEDPLTVTRERADDLVEEHRKQQANRIIQDFGKVGIQVLNGRYGPYITNGKINANVPKNVDPKSLSQEKCERLLAEAPKRRRGKRKRSRA